MATSNTKTAALVSRTATYNGLTCTTDGTSIAFHDDCDSPADALSRRTVQLDALLTTLLAETGGACNGMTEGTFHNLLWTAEGIAREVRLLAEVLQ